MGTRSPEKWRAEWAGWPIGQRAADEGPSDDISAVTTPVERIAMMWTLAESAWKLAGRCRPAIPGAFQPASSGGEHARPTMALEGLSGLFRDRR